MKYAFIIAIREWKCTLVVSFSSFLCKASKFFLAFSKIRPCLWEMCMSPNQGTLSLLVSLQIGPNKISFKNTSNSPTEYNKLITQVRLVLPCKVCVRLSMNEN